jgi:hypothetical protein
MDALQMLAQAEALGFDLYDWWDVKGPDDSPIPGLDVLAAFIRQAMEGEP